MEFWLDLDNKFFLLINHLPHNFLTDVAALGLSHSIYLAWVLFFLYLFRHILVHQRSAGRGFVFLVLATLSGFVLNSYGFKDFFQRSRPFLTVESVQIVQKGLTDFSFPSGHAFSVALLATLFVRKKKFFQPLFFYALLVGLSRIYLGVHFPSDVAGGYLFGFIYGLSVNHFYERFLEPSEFHILRHRVETT